MSLEGIKQVTEAEEMTRRRKAEATHQAKTIRSDAQRAGEEALARARAQAEAEVAGYMKQAEEKAAQRSAQIVEQTKGACGDLRKAAERRMAEASALIVGRVVKV
ncbi:MAG TPA: hypothetical protein H9714_02925 [Candidatus Flavonifractor intestinipullorum]|uniref:V-type ATP synthase subunit H n=1 Tax=Candidatus Flavonifractor intestinipullorum TaxID=2838587 RepID=A0A9D2M957_9FIRM|nr:hypothetical protein [Candidatus Flavonifractor intestinipullorum]